MSYTQVNSQAALEQALTLARGSYQRNFLLGVESLSGATLSGKAACYGARYAESRSNMLSRMTAAGIPWEEYRGQYGKRILVLGVRAPAYP